jgi:hypothetical protein
MPESATTAKLDGASRAERRSEPRLSPSHVTIACLSPRRLPRTIVGRITDISLLGLGLLTNASIAPGEVIRIELIGAGSLRARVAHATPDGEGRWLIGCSLLAPLDEDIQARLLAE